MTIDDVPRRNRVDLYCPAELAIRAAMHAVEEMGAHVKLTDAIILLAQAKERVADYVDDIAGAPTPAAQPNHLDGDWE